MESAGEGRSSSIGLSSAPNSDTEGPVFSQLTTRPPTTRLAGNAAVGDDDANTGVNLANGVGVANGRATATFAPTPATFVGHRQDLGQSGFKLLKARKP